MSVEELGANCSCRSSARHAAAISISGFSDLGNQILFLQISCKNAPFYPWKPTLVFCDVLSCKIQSCRTESCLTPPCWKSLLKTKPRVMKCWEMIVTCSSPGFTTPAKSFLNPFEPLWSFLWEFWFSSNHNFDIFQTLVKERPPRLKNDFAFRNNSLPFIFIKQKIPNNLDLTLLACTNIRYICQFCVLPRIL